MVVNILGKWPSLFFA